MTTDGPTFELIERAKDGDPDALDELMRQHMPLLRAFVRARGGELLRRREADSDLVQTVCREALGSLDHYEWRGEGSFRYWLFSLAMHKLQNKREYHGAARRDPRREAKPDSSFEGLADAYRTMCSPSQHAIAREVVERVEAALDRIDPALRDVIVMSRVVGLSHSEIAARLGKSEGAVRTSLTRALAKLAAAMRAVEQETMPQDSTPPPA